jgi:hypothetical protein
VCARVAVQRPSIAHSLRQPAEPSPAPHHVFSLSPPPQISECRNRNYFRAPSRRKRNLILAKSLFCSSARLRQIAFLALCFDLSVPCFFSTPRAKCTSISIAGQVLGGGREIDNRFARAHSHTGLGGRPKCARTMTRG